MGRRRLIATLVGCACAWLSTGSAAASDRVEVRSFRFVGNTVFSGRELAEVLSGYPGRALGADELEAVRRKVTLHYVEAGYVNSGCVLEDQQVINGEVVLRVVEGRLAEINVHGTKRLREGYLRPRIKRGAGTPLNLHRLRETMLLMRDRPFLRTIKAELQPGASRGEGVLHVRVEEERLLHLGFTAHNQRPPSVGAEGVEADLTAENPLGWGDRLGVHCGLIQRDGDSARFPGTDNFGLSYMIPANSRDTSLGLRFDRRNFGVVEEPFAALDIETRAEFWSLELRHPLRRTLNEELTLSLTADLRESRTLLAGVPFSLAPGAVNGLTRLGVVRGSADYLRRRRRQVFAARATVSVGTDWPGTTDDGTDRDARFIAVSGQSQYLRELNGFKLLLGGAFQWANGPLLSLEQFNLGGATTVRGYRENTVVRDTGVRGSVEFRLPVVSPLAQGRWSSDVLQLAPFFDCGAAWNRGASTPSSEFLSSAGVGLIWNPNAKFSSRLFWGHAFQRPSGLDGDLQDHGFHFSLNYRPF